MAAIRKTGITTSLVGETLGTTSRSVSVLCKSDLINKFSKNKPIHAPITTGLSDADRSTRKWGLTVTSANTIGNFVYYVDSDGDIIYNKPTGGEASPYRLGDFAGYNHTADTPIRPFFKNNDSIDVAIYTNYGQEMQPIYGITTDETAVNLKELYGSTSLNHGVIIVYGSTKLFAVGTIPWNYSLFTNAFTGKTCTCYEFLTNLSAGTNSNNHTANATDVFYALPNCKNTVTFTKTGATVTNSDVTVMGNFTYTNGQVSGTVTVSSKDTTLTKYSGGTFAEVYVNISNTSSMRTSVASIVFTNVTVGSDEIKTLTDSTVIIGTFPTLYFQISTRKTNTSSYVTRTEPIMCATSISPGDRT